MTTYVLSANSTIAHLYSIENLRTDKLEPIKSFSHPESRQKWSDIVSDKRGRYQTDHGTRGSYERYDPKEQEAENFAKELVEEIKALDIKNTDHEQIILVSSPDFLGILRNLIGDSFPDMVTDITKDYTQLPAPELLEKIREHIFV